MRGHMNIKYLSIYFILRITQWVVDDIWYWGGYTKLWWIILTIVHLSYMQTPLNEAQTEHCYGPVIYYKTSVHVKWYYLTTQLPQRNILDQNAHDMVSF